MFHGNGLFQRLVFLILATAIGLVWGHQEFANQQWTRDFAVELKGDKIEADLIVSPHGFLVVREIPELKVYHVHHPDACSNKHVCKRHAEDLVALLRKSPRVTRVEQQFVLERDKRDSVSQSLVEKDFSRIDPIDFADSLDAGDFTYKRKVLERHERLKVNNNDPLFKKQWHLDNYGQIVNPGLDLNLLPAWKKGYMGQGSRVTVVDDGIDTKHPDLRHAYDPLLSADLNDPTDLTGNPHDPTPKQSEQNGHGTSCAGEIAARHNNSVCGCGVAPNINLGGVRVLAGKVTDLLEAFSVLHQHNKTEVYSCSWGPKDDGKKMEMPHHYTGMALHISATRGRNGLGNPFTFASGNGGTHGDNCGADGYVNTPHTFPMAAVNIYGRSVFYGERCSAIIAAVPVGGRTAKDMKPPENEVKARISTDFVNHKCTSTFAGTSAAAPLGAACLSLILQANRKLTWRDLQHIVAASARIPSDKELVWQRNGAGFHVSHHFGFGLMDCSRAIKIAQTWVNVGPRTSCKHQIFKGRDHVYAGRSRRYTFTVSCPNVASIEHVTVNLTMDHKMRGDIEIWLISPQGTVSRLLGSRVRDTSRAGIRFVFLTRLLLGESPNGRWTLEIRDLGRRPTKGTRGTVRFAEIEIFGSSTVPTHLRGRKAKRGHRMSAAQVKKAFVEERNAALNVLPIHDDVLKLRRKLEVVKKRDRGLNRELLEEIQMTTRKDGVSAMEVKSLIDLVQQSRRKRNEEDRFNDEDDEED